jgi:hypothetical protein
VLGVVLEPLLEPVLGMLLEPLLGELELLLLLDPLLGRLELLLPELPLGGVVLDGVTSIESTSVFSPDPAKLART